MKSYEEIRADIEARIKEKIPDLYTGVGSLIDSVFISPFAIELESAYIMMELAKQSVNLNTASGSDLDSLALSLGFVRKQAKPSTGTIKITTVPGFSKISIPTGTRFAVITSSQVNEFICSSDIEIYEAENTTEYVFEVVSSSMGANTNISETDNVVAIDTFDGIENITSIIFLGSSGGEDEESDENFRQRIMAALSSGVLSKRYFENIALKFVPTALFVSSPPLPYKLHTGYGVVIPPNHRIPTFYTFDYSVIYTGQSVVPVKLPKTPALFVAFVKVAFGENTYTIPSNYYTLENAFASQEFLETGVSSTLANLSVYTDSVLNILITEFFESANISNVFGYRLKFTVGYYYDQNIERIHEALNSETIAGTEIVAYEATSIPIAVSVKLDTLPEYLEGIRDRIRKYVGSKGMSKPIRKSELISELINYTPEGYTEPVDAIQSISEVKFYVMPISGVWGNQIYERDEIYFDELTAPDLKEISITIETEPADWLFLYASTNLVGSYYTTGSASAAKSGTGTETSIYLDVTNNGNAYYIDSPTKGFLLQGITLNNYHIEAAKIKVSVTENQNGFIDILNVISFTQDGKINQYEVLKTIQVATLNPTQDIVVPIIFNQQTGGCKNVAVRLYAGNQQGNAKIIIHAVEFIVRGVR